MANSSSVNIQGFVFIRGHMIHYIFGQTTIILSFPLYETLSCDFDFVGFIDQLQLGTLC